MSRALDATKRVAIYREAARRCETEATWGACIYIFFAGHGDTEIGPWHEDPEVEIFRAMFKPEDAGSLWWEDNDPRILALCFMAAMVEAGDA